MVELEMKQDITNNLNIEVVSILDKSGEEVSPEFAIIWQEEMDLLGFIYE